MTTQSAAQLKVLLDTTSECLHNIQNLNVSVDSWDPLVIFLLVQKLDPETHKDWEEHAYKSDSEPLPKWNDFKEFLEAKFRTLELLTNNTKEVKSNKERSTCHVATPTFENRNCVMCKESHTLCHCKEFTKMEPTERSEYVKNNNLCYNCLVPGHSASKCRVPVSCRICHRRHHSLLHQLKQTEPVAPTSPSQPLASSLHVVEDIEEVQANTVIALHLNTRQNSALLATAVVEARSNQGHIIPLRALIDQGSEESFISEKAAQLLKLDRQHVRGSITGLGPMKTEINHVCELQIKSQWDKTFILPVKAYVMSKQLTKKLPKKHIVQQPWPHLQGLQLADPNYNNSGPIDLLLGVRVYARILQADLVKGPPGTPCAQRTDLGWILFGESDSTSQEDSYLVMHHQVDIEDTLKSLWEIDPDTKRKYTKEEQLCEEIYEKTVTRNQEGRYIVKLPFKTENPKVLDGNTKEIATKRFMQLERRFKRSPNLKTEYTKGINDYLEEGHLEEVPEREKEDKAVYLPHHAVIRDDKETTRTRIVFDASCKGSNNVSLNDELMVGPQLQDDLRNLLMRWRLKRVCFVADVQKMYRQILVTKEDANYQRILWRQDESEELKEYRMLRVTFGTAPAPYLAVKTLQKIAIDEEEKQLGKQTNNHDEVAIKTIKEDFYMDDMLSGAATVEEAIAIAKEVTRILKQGGFQLMKWSSNNIEFMKSIDEDKRSANAQIELNLDGTIKALGIVWNLGADQFQYNLSLSSMPKTTTKRGILSDVQKLFDPLGWIAPSTVMAKMLMQRLWLEKVSWDECVSPELEEEWKQIRDDFENVKDIKMDRWLGTTDSEEEKIQIHGFSDASMRAYAAVVYIRVESKNKITTKIIAARTRVAPLKTISLPRLELCGALLLSKLMKQIGQAMRISTTNMFAWTDSSIVIAWLCGEPNRWKPFVANRVVEIVENLNNKHWYHVQSKDNPADIASRGMKLTTLKNCDLWWHGPSWLSEKEINISKQEDFTTDEEIKVQKIQTYLNIEDLEKQEKALTTQFGDFDNLTELLKSIVYCLRFLKHKKNPDDTDKDITTMELQNAMNICIKKVQQEEYQEEIERLTSNKQVKRKSSLRSLAPYVDGNKFLRVGGRLRYANIDEDRKHPIILGNKNSLVPLIIADAHTRTLHGTLAEMLCYLRSKYWILRAKSLVKRHIQKCLTCAKQNATSKPQIMGDLPETRVTPSRPFLHSGVDFAGPYQILMSKGRGGKTVKAYIAIFICMAVKAIHIELVGDLTSEAFIAAFKRFVARRGKCTHLWSDQGRNFVGANKELVEAWNEAKLKFTGPIAETLAIEGTQWHFIPAYSPNFGGLWEAGVKSIKYHLKRVLTTNLTFEEMTTVLSETEACLNSRPLCPIDNSDPENAEILTPGHFLIGEAPIVVPAADYKECKIHTLSRWQLTQKLLADFWRRWQDEYLSRLQQRPKWLKKEKEFKIGDIVLIKTDNLPPGKWSLGRIIDKHPAEDGFTRVYSVKSGSAVVKRSISKLCALPVDTETL
ncbi:uncharacterized protein LOC134676697 [Cydia fagiglandana]|uniref:uncharacterized protein LOC134676697 n=1 Tax=Cydia fagiglandana TaxID=1458189 RepID=UPI002FEE2D95